MTSFVCRAICLKITSGSRARDGSKSKSISVQITGPGALPISVVSNHCLATIVRLTPSDNNILLNSWPSANFGHSTGNDSNTLFRFWTSESAKIVHFAEGLIERSWGMFSLASISRPRMYFTLYQGQQYNKHTGKSPIGQVKSANN